MTTPTMTMAVAVVRLRMIAQGLEAQPGDYLRRLTRTDLEAITYAAAVLGMFVEALEEGE